MQVADDEIYLVVNAGCREKDLAHIGKHLDKYKVTGIPIQMHHGVESTRGSNVFDLCLS